MASDEEGAIPLVKPRKLTLFKGKKLEEASAEDLDRAGVGIRPARPGTMVARATHSEEVRKKLSRQRRARLIRWSATFFVVVVILVVVYLLTRS